MADVVEREKINKSVEEMENLFRESLNEAPCSEMEFRCGLTRAMEILEKNGVYERDFEDLREKAKQISLNTKESQHTCGSCKYEQLPEDVYPCDRCMYGPDNRYDFWEVKKEDE